MRSFSLVFLLIIFSAHSAEISCHLGLLKDQETTYPKLTALLKEKLAEKGITTYSIGSQQKLTDKTQYIDFKQTMVDALLFKPCQVIITIKKTAGKNISDRDPEVFKLDKIRKHPRLPFNDFTRCQKAVMDAVFMLPPCHKKTDIKS